MTVKESASTRKRYAEDGITGNFAGDDLGGDSPDLSRRSTLQTRRLTPTALFLQLKRRLPRRCRLALALGRRPQGRSVLYNL